MTKSLLHATFCEVSTSTKGPMKRIDDLLKLFCKPRFAAGILLLSGFTISCWCIMSRSPGGRPHVETQSIWLPSNATITNENSSEFQAYEKSWPRPEVVRKKVYKELNLEGLENYVSTLNDNKEFFYACKLKDDTWIATYNEAPKNSFATLSPNNISWDSQQKAFRIAWARSWRATIFVFIAVSMLGAAISTVPYLALMVLMQLMRLTRALWQRPKSFR